MNQSIQTLNPPSEIKPRLKALMQALLLDNDLIGETIQRSSFKSHFKPVIASLSKNLPAILMQMLDNVSEDDLRKGLSQVRDEFLPFVLDEKHHTLSAWAEGHYWDTLEPQKGLILKHLESFTGLSENENSFEE